MKLVLLGLVMIASVNTLLTSDSDSEFIPGNSDSEGYRSPVLSSDSDWTPQKKNDHGGARLQSPLKKQKISATKSSHIPTNNANEKHNKKSTYVPTKVYKGGMQIIGKDDNNHTLYRCDRDHCNHVGHFDTEARHMHSLYQCLPAEGLPCLDCRHLGKNSGLFIEVVKIADHYEKEHSDLKYWTCWCCGTETHEYNKDTNDEIDPKKAFIKHVAAYTPIKSVPLVFNNFNDLFLPIGKSKKVLKDILKNAKVIHLPEKSAPGEIELVWHMLLRDKYGNVAHKTNEAIDALNQLAQPAKPEIALLALVQLSRQKNN